MANYIAKAQDDCCKKTLGDAIRHLLNKPIRTMVLPLALPTGFGKTRIAIQGIMRTRNRKKCINASVILWPQKRTHVTSAWKSPVNWVPTSELKLKPKDLSFAWHHLTEGLSNGSRNVFKEEKKKLFFVLDQDDWVHSKIACSTLSSTKGPLFFIIDEWHDKNLIRKFQQFRPDIASPELRAERFWRETLLPKKMWDCTRKIFVLLVSATPISTTADMDERHDEKLIDDADFDSYIKTCYGSFLLLSRVGYSSGNYNILGNAYNELIKKEVGRLDYLKKTALTKNDHKYGESSKYLSSYLKVIDKVVKEKCVDDTLVYMNEQKRFLDSSQDTNLMKLNALLDLVGAAYPKRKFVVFCHHKDGVAKRVEEFLKDNLEDGEHAVYYTRPRCKGEELRMSEKQAKKEFNKPKSSLRILIVTDRDSQGIDLHESDAYLVHYELAWNPIRIIQRFGRVWRIIQRKKKTRPRDGSKPKEILITEMTCPRAFYIPFTYSSEEEQINRLRRRWFFLETLDQGLSQEKVKKRRASMTFAAIPMHIALGTRWTPEPDVHAK